MVIKVLCLNDDNHEPSFVTKDNCYYSAEDFMKKCLLDPHGDKYEVRGVYICDPQGKLAEIPEDDFITLFELVESRPSDIIVHGGMEAIVRRDEAFDLFWECGTERWI